ncbi:hypothetical protein FB565_003945 [Actinoplanes lutulentus]|uniref:Uncharacterized protein n=1 Tax=Actinoplanes lutulentus TaxID=1287878 RepID=A0A327ZJY8_9ACTN|nr:hypothetical protein [Actinoplanes lutulentus]MBB2944216.1 hypothetical protein [Actinoplanes lutulentus]RAK42551.1 hypothetical protein B0I29_102376 [Actinoplanes lutulentus]
MVSIDTTDTGQDWRPAGQGRRRLDTITASAIVLTANAIILLAIAVVGVPFMLFFFADETETWQRLWPLVASLTGALALGALNAVATVRFARRPSDPPRIADGVAALATAAAAAILLTATPGVAMLAAPFALVNVAAAWILFRAAYAQPAAASTLAEFPDHVPAFDFDEEAAVDLDKDAVADLDENATVEERSPAPGESSSAYEDLAPGVPAPDAPAASELAPARFTPHSDALTAGRFHSPAAARRRLRSQAAMLTLAGTRLPSRATRPRKP